MHPKIQEILAQIKPYNPEKIILFGSYAAGRAKDDSDVDLVVIKDTREPFHERQKKVRLLIRTTTPLDIFVFTPQEFEKAQSNNLFIKEVAETGKLIYG